MLGMRTSVCEVVDQPGAIDLGTNVSHPPQPRRIGRVMQVGPPEPLTPTCVAA